MVLQQQLKTLLQGSNTRLVKIRRVLTAFKKLIKGLDAYSGETKDFKTVGVKLNDHTIQYTLVRPESLELQEQLQVFFSQSMQIS